MSKTLNSHRSCKNDLNKSMEASKECRICLDDTETEDNPFIIPCKCIGSVRYIHVDCLRGWFSNKKEETYHRGILSIYWEEIKCELCKTPINLYEIALGDR